MKMMAPTTPMIKTEDDDDGGDNNNNNKTHQEHSTRTEHTKCTSKT